MKTTKLTYDKITSINKVGEVDDIITWRIEFEGSNHLTQNAAVQLLEVGDVIGFDDHGSMWVKL